MGVRRAGDGGSLLPKARLGFWRLRGLAGLGAISASKTENGSKKVKQYEIWWAALVSPIGRRPVLLLSRTPAFQYLSKVMVAEITVTVRGIPQEVPLGRQEGLRHPCVGNLDNIHVVPKACLTALIGTLPPKREREVKRALGYALGWAELKVL